MARYLLSSDNISDDNSFVIEDIKLDPIFVESVQSGDTPLSLILPLGDLNGDGIDEFTVQSSLSPSIEDNNFVPENYVIFGSSSLPNTISAADINGANGFNFGDESLIASGAVDLNGDELDELTISQVDLAVQGNVSSVILGSNAFPQTVDINALEGNNGFTVSDNQNSVVASSIGGDINNDGINDLTFFSSNLVEEPFMTTNKIVFGLENYPADLDISNLDGNNGFTVDGAIISGISNLNGDDFDDLIFFDNESPIANIVYGRSEFTAELDLTAIDSGEGYSIVEAAGNESDRFFGGFVDDINGDELDDIILQKGVFSEPTEGEPPELQINDVYVIYSNTDTATNTLDLANIDGSNGFTIDSDVDITGILDINGDDLQDLFLRNNTDNKTYVIFGGDSIPNNFDLTTLDGSNGFVIENTNLDPIALLNFGAVGDINGDGFDDLAIDAEDDTTYILLGSSEFSASIDLSDPDLEAIEVDEATTNEISSFTDINGDEIDDLVFNSTLNEEDNSLASNTILYGDNGLSFVSDNSEGEPTPEPEPEPEPTPEPEPEPEPEPSPEPTPEPEPEPSPEPTPEPTPEPSPEPTPEPEPGEEPDPQTVELFRFRNTTFDTGTYIFVGEEERDDIQSNPDFNQTFELEGDGNAAFVASREEGDDLIPFYRLQSIDIPGTYLFVSTGEYNAIFAEDSDQQDKWIQEGLDGEEDIPEFYLYGGSADRGTEFNRFQNTQNGTFLYAGPSETEAIENDSNFSDLFFNQGVAFESLT